MSNTKNSYGPEVSSIELEKLLDYIFDNGLKKESLTRSLDSENNYFTINRPTPICIWGSHGIGKTSLIKDYASKRGWKFRYCAPAQFEEMGDLHGLPVTYDPDPNVIGDEYTIYLPPEWVPKKDDEGPGILLLDDINRADDRILRGIMQLLQEFEMFSWKLPPKWLIVCTANPDSGEYSVTEMDDAMITRLMHFSMKYDLNSWLDWATKNNIDKRGIAFVLTYPEVIKGSRTTPRSLAQFFAQTIGIKDLKKEIEIVSSLAKSALEEITAEAFISFVNDELSELIDPEDILKAKSWSEISKRLDELYTDEKEGKRIDRISTIVNRLILHLKEEETKLDQRSKHNIVNFIMDKSIPGDIRFSLHKDLISIGGEIAETLRRKDVAEKILEVL